MQHMSMPFLVRNETNPIISVSLMLEKTIRIIIFPFILSDDDEEVQMVPNLHDVDLPMPDIPIPDLPSATQPTPSTSANPPPPAPLSQPSTSRPSRRRNRRHPVEAGFQTVHRHNTRSAERSALDHILSRDDSDDDFVL